MGVRSSKPKAPALPKTNVTRYAKHTDAVFVRFMLCLVVSGDVVFLKKRCEERRVCCCFSFCPHTRCDTR